ncbi:MAG TPA: hypothetical protein VIC62_13255, partial [Nakamurella sp.]
MPESPDAASAGDAVTEPVPVTDGSPPGPSAPSAPTGRSGFGARARKARARRRRIVLAVAGVVTLTVLGEGLAAARTTSSTSTVR